MPVCHGSTAFAAPAVFSNSLKTESVANPLAAEVLRNQRTTSGQRSDRTIQRDTVRSNRRSCVLARQVAMYIARQLTGASPQEIGREFGNRNHSTVLHSINKIEAMRRSDEGLNRTITRLLRAVVART
jgi:chromosomal replication initiation ATPase DnaA